MSGYSCRYSWQVYGMNVSLFSFTVSLQYRLMAPANLLLLFEAKAKAKVKPCDTMTSYWLMCCNEILFGDMLGGSTSMPHSDGYKSLNLSSWTSVNFPYDLSWLLLPWSGGPKLNLGGFSCCAADARQRMRWGYFSLSYMRVCYKYGYEKCFR